MILTKLLTLLTGKNKTGIFAAVIVFFLCGESFGSITRRTVESAWKRITDTDKFRKIPIIYEDDSEPNAWVNFQDEDRFTVHVTSGLMMILEAEEEIAGVLGHEIGHVRLGHYGGFILSDTARAVMDINAEEAEDISQAVGDINMELQESKFSRKQETEADDYGTELLTRAGYNSWGLYNAMKRFDDYGYGTGQSGFNSHPSSEERLSHLEDMAGKFQPVGKNQPRGKRTKRGENSEKPSARDSLGELADTLMGQSATPRLKP